MGEPTLPGNLDNRRRTTKVVLLNVVKQAPAVRGSAKVENAALCYLAGALRENGIQFVVLDNILEAKPIADLVQDLPQGEDLLIAAHLMGRNWVEGACEFIRLARETHYPIVYTVAGGQYASLYANEIAAEYPEIERIVCGEGEERIVEIASAVRAGSPERTTRIDPNYARVELDTLPRPYHYTLEAGSQAKIVIWASRGCHGNCSFCMIPAFYGRVGRRWGRRPTQDVRDEILEIHHRQGVCDFEFGDESFIPRDARDIEAVTEMLRSLQTRITGFSFSIYAKPEQVEVGLFRRWQVYGLRHVFLGIESFNDAFCRLLGKTNRRADNVRSIEILTSLDMAYAMGFIIIAPNYTIEDVQNELRALATYVMPSPVNPASLFYALTNRLLVYDKTRLYEQLSAAGLIDPQGYDRFYDIYPYRIDPRVGAYLHTMQQYQRGREGLITANAAHEALDLAMQVADELAGIGLSGDN